MKAGWKIKRLEEICSIELGSTPPRKSPRFWDTKRETGNVWLSIADLLKGDGRIVTDSKEYLSDEGRARGKIVEAGTLLLSFKLTIGRLAFAGRDLQTNEAIAALKLKASDQISKEFLYWYLMFFDWDKAAEGEEKIKGKTLNKAKLRLLEILIPPLEEQRQIVKILDQAFAAIASAAANSEKNLTNVRALFESYLQSTLQTNDGDWIEEPLANCFRLKSGDGLTAKNMVEGPFPVFGGNGIAGYHDESNLDGDNLIIGRVGALCGNARHIQVPIWLTDNAFKVVDKKYDFDNAFLNNLINFMDLRSFARQSAQPVISNSSLKDISVRFPSSTKKQKEIALALNVLSHKRETLEKVISQKIAALTELEQSLLEKAFSGELT